MKYYIFLFLFFLLFYLFLCFPCVLCVCSLARDTKEKATCRDGELSVDGVHTSASI